MREKLIELVGQVQDCGCDVTDVVEMRYVENEVLVDHLIANGVTLQKWIPVSERLPEYGKVVLACGKRHATSGQFQGAYPSDPHYWFWRGCSKYVTHWMPLPEAPKGE